MRQVSHTAGESSPGLSEGVVKIIFLLLGIGILLPWNAFVTAKPYFEARFCSSDGTDTIDFELWFGLAWNLASVVSLGAIIVFQMAKDRQVKYNGIAEDPLSPTDESQEQPLNPNNDICNSHNNEGHSFWLVMMPLSLFLIVFVFTAFLVFVPDIPPTTFTVITLIGLAVCGMCGAIATAGVVSTASLFPSHVGINPFFSGQAVGGVAVSAANFVAATMEDSSSFWGQHCEGDENENSNGLQSQATCSSYEQVDWVVFVYFFLGCVVLGSCLVGYSYIDRYQRSEHRDDYEHVRDNTVHDKVDESPRIGLELKGRSRERQEAESDIVRPDSPTSYRDDPLTEPSSLAIDAQANPVSTEPRQNPDEGNTTAAVWNAIKGPAWCIFLTFSVTLSLFPGWISQLRSSHECETHFRLNNDLYTPLSFLVFNVGDLMGRLVSAKVPVDRIRNMSHKLVFGALLRVVFFPLFLLCAAGAADRAAVTIPSDLYSLAVQLLFAFSNGILISCSFMHAPHLIANNTSMQERSSEIMTFAVSFGLLSGSLLSFPFSIISSRW